MTDTRRVWAIVVAAGRGERMGAGVSKGFLELGGMPILERTLIACHDCDLIDGVVLVLGARDHVHWRDLAFGRLRSIQDARPLDKVIEVVTGGEQRQDSVFKGLEFLSTRAGPGDLVVIHDGARPLVTPGLLAGAIEGARQHDAVTVGVPVTDTHKLVGADGQVESTVDRGRLWSVQTPQVFSFELIWEAHRRAAGEGFRGTDDASLIEWFGFPVHMIPGIQENIKVTTPIDLVVAESILAARGEGPAGGARAGGARPSLSVGIGYDVHRTDPGRRLVLGGVEIPEGPGLVGHSDADVLLHAIMDALLGAAGLGDLGTHFPDSDPAYRDIASSRLAATVLDLLADGDRAILSVDVTMVAQEPRLAPRAGEIRRSIARILRIEPERVNFKATTSEGLGFSGRGEGMAAYAVVLLT